LYNSYLTETLPFGFGKLLAKDTYQHFAEEFSTEFFEKNERKKLWYERKVLTNHDSIQNDTCICDDEKSLFATKRD